jgi:diguanylate cyclase (GGDEF)-like protein
MAFIGLHAAVFAIGLIESLLDLLPQRGLLGFNVLFGVIHFEQLVFAMGSSIFLVALVREQSEMAHRAAAAVDMLTGLATRRAFLDKAQRDLVDCRDRCAPLALMMFDLDHFKAVNDNHGHAVGDQVLRTFAQVARGALRTNDFIGRLGGEEFAIVMPGTSMRAAGHIANRIRRAFAESRIVINGKTISATISGGIASAEGDMTLEQLLSTADAALYRAKAKGRNRIELTRPADDRHDTAVVVRVA